MGGKPCAPTYPVGLARRISPTWRGSTTGPAEVAARKACWRGALRTQPLGRMPFLRSRGTTLEIGTSARVYSVELIRPDKHLRSPLENKVKPFGPSFGFNATVKTPSP
jgi:hypothetical protein